MISECCRLFSLEEPGEILKFKASPEECEALSLRFGMQIKTFSASMESKLALDGVSLVVQGRVKGQGKVLSPVTSEIVKHQIDATFETIFSPQGNPKVVIDETADQEFFSVPEVDMGEVCAQYLYLELDEDSFHFNRGVEEEPEAEAETTHMPFLALQALLSKKEG